jgi:hypothetical protein
LGGGADALLVPPPAGAHGFDNRKNGGRHRSLLSVGVIFVRTHVICVFV